MSHTAVPLVFRCLYMFSVTDSECTTTIEYENHFKTSKVSEGPNHATRRHAWYSAPCKRSQPKWTIYSTLLGNWTTKQYYLYSTKKSFTMMDDRFPTSTKELPYKWTQMQWRIIITSFFYNLYFFSFLSSSAEIISIFLLNYLTWAYMGFVWVRTIEKMAMRTPFSFILS